LSYTLKPHLHWQNLLCTTKMATLLALATLDEVTQTDKILIRINQVPVSVARWQHGSQTCFATYLLKIQKIVNNSTTTKAREKK
jgi:hypothetical protein